MFCSEFKKKKNCNIGKDFQNFASNDKEMNLNFQQKRGDFEKILSINTIS